MKAFLLALLLLLQVSAQVPRPQVPVTGNIGPGGNFSLFNSGTIVMADTNYIMQYPDMSARVLVIHSSVPLTNTRSVIAPQGAGFEFIVENATAGGQSIVFSGATGTGVTIANGQIQAVVSDGTNYGITGSSGSSVPINGLQGATNPNDISNGNFTQAWRWTLTGTTGEDGLYISETTPSTNTGTNSALVGISTLTNSTAQPFRAFVHNGAAGIVVTQNGDFAFSGSTKFLIPDWTGTPVNLHSIFGGAGNIYVAGGATTDNSDNWVAHAQRASIIQLGSPGGRTGGFTLYANDSLTAGNIFSPTAVFGVSETGAIQSNSLASGTTSNIQADPAGNIILATGGTTPINSLAAAGAPNSINNGSFDQDWNWSLTGTNAVAGFAISENAASTNTNPNSVLMAIGTRTNSTVPPFSVGAHDGAAGLMVTASGNVVVTGTADFTFAHGINPSAGFQAVRSVNFEGSVTGIAFGANVQNTFTWPVAFPDNNYAVVCSAYIAQGMPGLGGITHTPTTITITTVNLYNGGLPSQGAWHCIAVHDP